MNSKIILGYAVGPIGSGLIGFITLPIIAWFYSPEDIGRITMLHIFTSFSVLLFCLGLDQFYVREYHETPNKAKLLQQVLFPSCFFAFFGLIGIFIIKPTIISSWLYSIDSIYLSAVTVLCFFAALVSRFLSLILRMQDRSLAFSMSQLLPKILLLFFIAITATMNLLQDTFNLLTANALAILMAMGIYLCNTYKDWGVALTEKLDMSKFAQQLQFGLPLVVSGFAYWGLTVIDKLFLRYFSSYTELGVYSVAVSIAGVVTLFGGIFNTIWAPLVFKWVSEDRVDYQKIDFISECVLAIIFFMAVLSGLFSWIIPFLLPQVYNEVQYLVTLCLLAPCFYTLSETTAIGITIMKKTQYSMYASLLACIVCLTLAFFLVKEYGAMGAAISLAIATFSFYVFRTLFSNFVWRVLPYKKSFLVSSFLIFTAIMNFVWKDDPLFRYTMWILMLCVGIFLFKKLISVLLNLIKNRFVM